MTASYIVLHIIGAVCLLLWGTRMVRRGITRAYGSSLRAFIAKGTSNRIISCASGIAATALLQSSTAAALLMLSFVKKHSITITAALAFIIGADIATTLVAQILTFDLSWLSPALLTIGIIGHMRYEHGGRRKHICGVFIGVGLMLLSLALIREASSPLTQSQVLPLILAPLESDPVMAILFAALLTWIIHSSLAAILLFAALASGGIIDLHLGFLLVMGANLGGAFITFIATYKEDHIARRITFGNIIMRALTVIILGLFTHDILSVLATLNMDTARAIVSMHMGFNIALGIAFLPFVQMIALVSEKIFPAPKTTKIDENDPIYLDDQALETPVIALASAARETLRMAEIVENMLEQTIESFKQNNATLAKKISCEDDRVDHLYRAIKLYLAKLTQESLDPKEADRYLQILTFSTNLEHVGDIIEKSLMELAQKKIKAKERFSDEGWDEIKNFHGKVLDNMKLAQTIFLSEDPALARQLIGAKKDIREAEQATSTQHFQRLREGLPETIATSSIHLDIIRDYRRINSYIATVAYAILENAVRHADERRKH